MAVSIVGVAGRSGALGADPVVDISGIALQDGDVLVAVGICSGSTTMAAHANFGARQGLSDTAPLWTREVVDAGSEPTSYTFVVSSTGNSLAVIVALRGVGSAPVVDDLDGITGTGNLVIPEVTSGGADRELVQIVLKQTNTTFTTTGGGSEVSDATYLSQNYAAVVATETVGAGGTGTRQWNPAGGVGIGVGYMLAVNDGVIGQTVTVPAAATATAEAKVPTVTAGSDVAAVPATATAAGQAPAVSAGATVAPPPAEATASSPFGGVTASGGATITPPPATATADPGVPSVSAGSAVAAPASAASAAAIVPTVGAGSTVAAVPATATAQANAGDGVVDSAVFFDPPTQAQAMPDHFWGRFSIPVGISVVKIDGHYENVPTPTHDDLVGVEGTDWFRGGYHYGVAADVADDLTADGYGSNLTKEAHVH